MSSIVDLYFIILTWLNGGQNRNEPTTIYNSTCTRCKPELVLSLISGVMCCTEGSGFVRNISQMEHVLYGKTAVTCGCY